jgi:Holliday junction resolvase
MTSIQKQNKDRSKRQEREIAKYLGGKRQIMSGALKGYKGDVIIPYDEYRSIYIECKVTTVNNYYAAKDVLTDMHTNAKEMHCICGILIVKFNNRGSSVLIRVEDYNRWFSQYVDTIIFVDYAFNISQEKVTVFINYDNVTSVQYHEEPLVIVLRGENYLQIPLQTFKEILEKARNGLQTGIE